ncbi:MAG TPA: sigma-70 family RNA polymerase sigma factor [Puia sp.]|nr:sigma-70 family RNA polymerase sigma factor [Puia sp.]
MMPLSQNDDCLLLNKLREGSVDSFNALYDKYWYTVYNSAFKRLRNHAQVQDIAQDIFASLWLRREELQIENLSAYLHTAVRNRVLNLFEKEQRYVPIEQLMPEKVFHQQNQADALTLQHELIDRYGLLVDSLPSQRKIIFRQYYQEGRSTEEIAHELSLSRKTVQNQLGRAVTFLRTHLSEGSFCLILLWLSGK